MPALPTDSDFNLATRKQSEFRAATSSLLAYLRGLLGSDGLSSTARQFLGISVASAAYNPRGNWSATGVYPVNDYVVHNSALYVAVNPVGPSATVPSSDPTNWQPFQSLTVANLAQASLNAGLVDEYSTTLAGAVGDGVADDTVKVQNAGGFGMAVVIVGTPKITNSVTFSVPVRFAPGARLILSGSGISLTFNSGVSGPEGQQLWVVSNATSTALATTTYGTVTIAKANPKPEWWGDVQGALRAAIESLPAAGGVVELGNRRYRPNGFAYGFSGSGTFIGKDNVTLKGTKMPWVTSDCKALQGGTIIEDMLLGYSNNIAFENLGVDSGKTVNDTYFGGNITAGSNEGLLLTYPNDATKNASPAALRRGARLHNVISLVRNPTDATHSIIAAEGYDDVVMTGAIIAVYGLHGVVFKGSNVRCESLESFMQSGEGCIIKTDAQATAVAAGIQVGKMALYNSGPAGTTPHTAATGSYGFLLNPASGNIDGVQIGEIYEQGHAEGARLGVGSNTMSRVQIGHIRTDGNSIYGTRLVGTLKQSSIESVTGSNSQAAFSDESAGNSIVTIGAISGANNSIAHANFETSSSCVIGTLKGEGGSLMRFAGNARPLIDKLAPIGVSSIFSSANGGLVPALSNGWTNFGAGNSVFSVRHSGNGIWLQGLVKPGSSNVVAALPYFARPALTKRLVAQGSNGSAKVPVDIVIDSAGTSGNITINEIAGGVANASQYLSLDPVYYSLLD